MSLALRGAAPALFVALAISAPCAAAPRVLDGFESTSAWRAVPADGVLMKLSTEPGPWGRCLRIDSADCCREVVISRVAGGIDRQAIRCRDGLEPAGWLEHRKVPRRRSAVRDIADHHGEVADEAVGGEPREHARMRGYRLHEQAHDRIRFAERWHIHRVWRTAERCSRRLSRRRR